jgi:hemerythrin-like metal-binding protein
MHHEALSWDDGMLLGHEPIDALHREFVDLVAVLQGCDDAMLPCALDRVIDHLRAHFGAEDESMRETGFPPRECHIDEHAAVLRSAEEVRARVAAGELDTGRSFAQALAEWFPGHAVHLDSALAHWLVKRRHGGKPVVLRRHWKPQALPAEGQAR